MAGPLPRSGWTAAVGAGDVRTQTRRRAVPDADRERDGQGGVDRSGSRSGAFAGLRRTLDRTAARAASAHAAAVPLDAQEAHYAVPGRGAAGQPGHSADTGVAGQAAR